MSVRLYDIRRYSVETAKRVIKLFSLSWSFHSSTRRALGEAHLPPTKVFRWLTASVNETVVKPRVAAAVGRRTILKPRLATAINTYRPTSDFPDVKFRVAWLTISGKAIRFWHPDYNPERAQKLISLSISRHLSTRNISSKSMHAFLSNLANRQTDKQTNAGKNIYLLLCPLSEVNNDTSVCRHTQYIVHRI